jgi:hypothetical protein
VSQVEGREGELPEQLPPPEWDGGPEITESEFRFMLLRRSANDYARIMDALQFSGSLTVVPDPVVEQPPLPGEPSPEEPPPEE